MKAKGRPTHNKRTSVQSFIFNWLPTAYFLVAIIAVPTIILCELNILSSAFVWTFLLNLLLVGPLDVDKNNVTRKAYVQGLGAFLNNILMLVIHLIAYYSNTEIRNALVLGYSPTEQALTLTFLFMHTVYTILLLLSFTFRIRPVTLALSQRSALSESDSEAS